MVVSEKAAEVQEEGNRQSTELLITSREWYFRASAEYSSLLISSEVERIQQYAQDANTRARNLGALWVIDPFPQDLFMSEAASIIEQSDSIDDDVNLLKNTVVRFMHACKLDDGKMTRSRRNRRRIVRRRSGAVPADRQDPIRISGGIP